MTAARPTKREELARTVVERATGCVLLRSGKAPPKSFPDFSCPQPYDSEAPCCFWEIKCGSDYLSPGQCRMFRALVTVGNIVHVAYVDRKAERILRIDAVPEDLDAKPLLVLTTDGKIWANYARQVWLAMIGRGKMPVKHEPLPEARR